MGVGAEDFGHAVLMIQDATNLDTWVAIGPGKTVLDGTRLFVHKTTDGVTSTRIILNVIFNQVRILRNVSSWVLQYRDTVGGGPDAAWTTAGILTGPAMSVNENVGFALFSDDSTANDINGSIALIEFARGGFTDCNYTKSDCTERENLVQRNAYLGLPDGLLSFF